MYRTLMGIAVALAIGLGIVGLTFSANRGEPAEFIFVNGTEPKSLDPHIMTGQPEGRLADALFEGLTFKDPKSLIPQPGMAESWAISNEGRTYTFKMRPGVTWNDGTPITSEDFAYSWRRLQEPELASEYAYFMHMIKWAGEFNTYQGNVYALLGLPPAKANAEDEAESESQRKMLTEIVSAFEQDGNLETARTALAAWTNLRKAEKKIRRSDGTKEDAPIRGAIRAFELLMKERTEPLTRAAWNRFVQDEHLTDALKNTENATLQNALSAQEPTISVARMTEIRDALVSVAIFRWSQWMKANARFGKSEGVYAPDPATLIVELNAQTPYFLDVVSFYSALPVPRHVVEVAGNNDDWFLPDKIVTNGPFQMVSWRVNERMRLTKSAKYWNKNSIKLASVDALPVETKTAALNMFLTNEVDWSSKPPADVVEVLKSSPEYRSVPGFMVYYFRFNCTRPPFSDPRVRQAVCMAVNRREIVDGVTRAGENPTTRLVPPGLPGYDPPESFIREDPKAAREMFDAAMRSMKGPDGKLLYPDGKLKEPLQLLHNTDEGHAKIADALADQLRKSLGITVKPANQEWQAYQASTREMKYDLARAGWIGDYMDPNTFLDLWETNGGNNQTGWSSPLYDQLLRFARDPEKFLPVASKWVPQFKEKAKAEALVRAANSGTDRAGALGRLRMHFFREAEAILFQDGFPILPLYFYVAQNMVKPHVKGWYSTLEMPDGSTKPNRQDIHPIRGMWIDRGAKQGVGDAK